MTSRSKKFNADWFFSKHPIHTDLAAVTAGGFAWTPVTVPHDWLIADSRNLYESGEGWYRKTFDLFAHDPGTRWFARFEGVYMNAELYVNGQLAGAWKNGYTTFEFEITPFVRAEGNEIYVRVVHESPNSRWYSGAGIYRSVWLTARPDTHIAPDGIYLSASASGPGGDWTADAETEIVMGGAAAEADGLTVRHRLLDAEGKTIALSESPVPVLEPGAVARVSARLSVEAPELWDIERPYLYRWVTELAENGAVTQEVSQSFGFRSLKLDSRRGFFLNGRNVKLRGVCQHHDLGCLGAAVNKAALRRQISLLREMGVNAIRTAHNAPAVELMELADEMGVLIVSEAFDMWERPKTPYDYARFFPEWWRKDVASWVRRDRNRPSLLMWSIGNEIYDTHADDRGQELTRMLRDEVRLHDPRSNAFVTIGSNYMPWENARKCAELVDAVGYNYAEKYYDLHHREHPDWIIYGSETSSTVQSRGIYHFPLSQSVLADDDEQCSSLGNSSTSWGAKSAEACIVADRDAAYSLGQFLWSGFDYIGEPTPYHTKNSYFGQLDTAGFKKDSFYLYQAEWTDYRVRPMIHVFPYWDFSEGQLIDVRACSNAPKIELFLNDRSLGVAHIDHARGTKLLGEWRIPYSPGVLRAVAYDEEGKPIATDVRASFGDAESIALKADKGTMEADGSDLVFIEISASDRRGLPVENANNRVRVAVEGPGRLVGLDNGDSTDYDSYKGDSRRLFGGKLLAVVASTLDAGDVVVTVSSNGLRTGEIKLTSVAPSRAGLPDDEELPLYDVRVPVRSPESGPPDEIPVRKLEIVCPRGNLLSPGNRSLPLRVNIRPGNATYRDVLWRVTNAAGVDFPIASLQANGQEATLTALGDGDLYVRCATTNGSERIRLYSLMEFKIEGLGRASLDPYEFVSAGFRGERSANLTNGNERGVATSRDGESRICFDNLDFGRYGSDEITLPIFSLDGEEFPIEIWEGVPGDGDAALLARVTYRKPSRWNVYQEETYRLPKRLTGVTSLCFVLRRKIHLKGFRFTKPRKAYETLGALDRDQIYGDSYRTTPDAIEQIGNNVSLVYRDMDFGEDGSAKLVVCGRSALDRSTIHLLFSGPQGESRQALEFAGSDEYVEREYALDRVSGPQTVTFVFLPGSRFDLKRFRFLPAR